MEIVWRYNDGRTVSKSGEGEEGRLLPAKVRADNIPGK